MPAVTIEAAHLKRAIAAVKPVIQSKTTIPILASARIEVMGGVMTVEGTNLDQAVRIEVPADGNGSWCIDFGKLSAFAGIVPDGGQVTIDGDSTAALRCGKLSAKIGALPIADYPAISAASSPLTFELPVKAFRDAVTRLAGCRMKDGSTQALSGIHVQGLSGKALRVEATDSKALARLDLPLAAPASFDVILPGEIIQPMAGLPDGDMTVCATEGMVSMSCAGVTLVSKLIDGRYPEIDRVLNSQRAALGRASRFDTAYLVSAIKAASVSQTWDSEKLWIVVNDDGAHVRGTGQAGEEIVIPVDCEPGDPFEALINPAYFQAMLAAAKMETIGLAAADNANAGGLCCMEDGAPFQGICCWLRGSNVGHNRREAA